MQKMDADKPLITENSGRKQTGLDRSHSRECTPNPEVRIQTPSEVSISINDEPGVVSAINSPDGDTQSDNDKPKSLRTSFRARSEQLLSSASEDSHKDADQSDSQSWQERSRSKLKWGQRSLDTDLKTEELNQKPKIFRAKSDCGEVYIHPACVFRTNPPSAASSISYLQHKIMVEEIAPTESSIMQGKHDDEKDWKVPLEEFSSKRRGKQKEDKGLPKRIRRYYKTQDELISAFEDLQMEVDDAMESAAAQQRLLHLASIMAKVSLAANLLLLIGKAIAAGLTGSLSVISAVVDSGVDLVSGALMWWSSRAIKNRDLYQYPQGRTKLEPVAIVIVSVVMALASVQMIRESVEKIIRFATEDAEGPVFGLPAIILCVLTVIIKLVLFIICKRIKTPSTQTLATDHRNDVISNSGALVCGYIGYKYWKYMDPIGAMIISFYILISWFITGWTQIKMLTGHTARPDFLKKITWIALNHHPDVLLIDTVRAFHFGSNFLVEVDIVLPEEMNLREAHDIGESLQVKIEHLTEVERAFVHLDYECEHSPFSEHKQV